MVKKPQTKKIKIVSKGIVTTSRGRCRTPITSPYVENVNVIFSMLTRDNAKINEVLPNGKEVELTIYNFSQDNTVEPEKVVVPAAHVADPAVVNAGKNPNEVKVDRPLTRKERRELERKARAEAQAQNTQPVEEVTETTETVDESPVEEPVKIEESSAIVEDAISE